MWQATAGKPCKKGVRWGGIEREQPAPNAHFVLARTVSGVALCCDFSVVRSTRGLTLCMQASCKGAAHQVCTLSVPHTMPTAHPVPLSFH